MEHETHNTDVLQSFSTLPKNSTELGRESFSYDAALILMGMGMEKYAELLKANDISLEIFMELNEADLHSLGIEDEEDRKKILSHTRGNKTRHLDTDLYVSENAAEDSMIARNILNQSVHLDNQLKQILLQLNRNEVNDYFITNRTKASQVLKVVTEKAIQQTAKICNSIHNSKSENLISALLKKSNLDLPAFLRDKLQVRPKLRKKRAFLMILTALGVCSLATLFASAVSSA